MAQFVYSGAAPETTLASDITDSSDAISLTSGTGYPSPTDGKLAKITIAPDTSNEEHVYYDTRSGNSLSNCLRGQDASTARQHSAGAPVVHTFVAEEASDLSALLNLPTAAGDTVYASGAATYVRLAKGTAYQAYIMNAGATAPSWAASLQSLLTASGDIVYASGANTPARLAKGDDGDVLTLASGVPSWAASSGTSLTSDAGNMASNTTLTASTVVTLVTTGSLAVGTWLVAAGTMANAGSSSEVEAFIEAGTATATFAGKTSDGVTTDAKVANLGILCIATITVAGTLRLRGRSVVAGTAFAATPQSTFPEATGYTAVKIA